MKMELSLRAPVDGVLTHVDAVAGTQVPLGEHLFTVQAAGPDQPAEGETP
jgi:biotin carboxyl carrier protein